jgi:hypothetical protein
MTYEMMVRYSLCLPWAVICVCVLALINPVSGLIETAMAKGKAAGRTKPNGAQQ